MPKKGNSLDAVIIGSGPNGLSAAIRLALEGLSVKVFESAEVIGGGARSTELMQPQVIHDVCSAIHPMAIASPFLSRLPLNTFGLRWIHPLYPVAHPLDDGSAVLQHQSLENMSVEVGNDFKAWRNLYSNICENWENLLPDLMGPLRIPTQPVMAFQFGMKALVSAENLVNRHFSGRRARALFGGISAHSVLPLDKPVSAAAGMLLGAAAHTTGWPIPAGGSRSVSNALGDYFKHLGGVIETGRKIENMSMLPDSKVQLFDLTPAQLVQIDGLELPERLRKKLLGFRYGPGVFKIDYILSEPVPWSDSRCKGAGTLHLGGSFEEISDSEKQVNEGCHPDKPFVLAAQQSLFDRSRTPDNRHTFWAYTHVPAGSNRDMTVSIEKQIERFAPGFHDIILQRQTLTASGFEAYNANYIGGDINGGKQDLRQLFSRPVSLFNPYLLTKKGAFICSSSTPPGGGVHGMCGFHAAEAALDQIFKIRERDRQFRL